MTQQYRIRRAQLDDLDAVVELLERRTRWLAERGSDQWSTNRHRLRSRMAAHITQDRTWLLTDHAGAVLGTITVSTDADPDFWTAEEQRTPALYLSRLATDPAHAGQNLGHIMLSWAIHEAARRHLVEVRLDAWKTATGLHDYYRDEGWTYRRTVHATGRYSGALFSHPADRIHVPSLLWDGVTEDNTTRGTV